MSTNQVNNSEDSTVQVSKKSLTRDSNNKILAGVCSGMANYFNLDPVVVRVIATILLFGLGASAFAYIALIFVIPQESTRGAFIRDENRKLLGGVCSGIAKYFDINLTALRIIGIALFLLSLITFGFAMLLATYLILYFVMRPQTESMN